MIKKLENELGKQSRIKIAAISSKMKYEELYNNILNQYNELDSNYNQLQTTNNNHINEIQEAEKYIDQLHQIVKEIETKCSKLDEKLKIQNALNKSQELLIQKYQQENGPLVQEEIERKNEILIQTQEQNVRLQQQLKTALYQMNQYKNENEILKLREH